jgi:hypothetical protein
MKQIPERLAAVRQRIRDAARACGRNPETIKLLAVSKTKPTAAIRSAIDAGHRAFGENYLQDALPKIQALDDPTLEWHFIGRVQSNKTAEISRYFDWVHGIDRLKHAQRLGRQRPPGSPPLNVCLQVNLSGESSKGGVTAADAPDLAAAIAPLPGLRLRGLMTLPDPDYDERQTAQVFEALARLQAELNRSGLALDTLSMGMSRDLEIAIAAGSTLVRVGTDIFGPRQ